MHVLLLALFQKCSARGHNTFLRTVFPTFHPWSVPVNDDLPTWTIAAGQHVDRPLQVFVSFSIDQAVPRCKDSSKFKMNEYLLKKHARYSLINCITTIYIRG